MRRRAFTLTEMLFALILLTIFAGAATQLFYSSMRLSRSSADAQNAAASFDSAVAMLRDDTWSAKSMSVEPAQATLGEISWTIRQANMTRKSGNEQRQWAVPDGATFAADGPELILRIPASKRSAGGEVRMANEPAVLEKIAS